MKILKVCGLFLVLNTILISNALAAPKINGSYNSQLTLKKVTVVNSANCSNAPISRNFVIKDVKLNRKTNKITGRFTYPGWSGYYRLNGKTTNKGFVLNLKASDTYYTYVYKYNFTKITSRRANLQEAGKTVYKGTANGCRYVYKGIATR